MASVVAPKAAFSRNLASITRHEVNQYAGNTLDGRLVACLDDQNQVYSVIGVPSFPREYSVEVVVMAQVVGDYVVIVEDITDKPLYEALMVNAKIPREQIILEYAGETLPTSDTKAD